MDRRNLRILVIDDNPDATIALSRLLQTTGFSVVAQICNPVAAVASIKQERPHVVILDIMMPRISGYEIARRVRAEVEPPPRLIALTALDKECDRSDAASAGFDAHMAKPANWQELEALLLGYLSQRTPALCAAN